MTGDDHDQAAPAVVAGEMTSVFRADFLPQHDTHDPDRAPGSQAPEADPAPGSHLLVVVRGPNAGSRLVLNKATTSAGRHPHSDIFLDDVTVSRRHAQFQVLDGGHVEVVDVGSLNGTFVNRAQVDSARLVDGDEVQLGKFRLVYRTGRSMRQR